MCGSAFFVFIVRNSLRHIIFCAFAIVACAAVAESGRSDADAIADSLELNLAELFGPPAPKDYIVLGGDTIRFDFDAMVGHKALTERDYAEVARELGVETAAIKAVVEIETGRAHRGFNPDGTPVINFDLAIFRKMARKNGVNLSRYSRSHPAVFRRPDIGAHGSQQAAEHAVYSSAADIDELTAIEGTFWGMFQIGGFNWRMTGASSPTEFVARMSANERQQLELFAGFIRRSGLLKYLQAKNWSAFARGYNGPSYAARGYHTRLAKAYNKYKKQG